MSELPWPILCPKCDQLLARTDGKQIQPESLDSVPIEDIDPSGAIVTAGYHLRCGCGALKEWRPLP